MRYIDADALIKKIFPIGIGDGKYTINAKAVKLAIDNAPTADVEPRSEVERLKAENERLVDLVKELQGYNEAWVEDNGKLRNENKKLAMEIFEDIEEYAKLQLEGLNIAGKVKPIAFEFFGGATQAFCLLLNHLAKLKKKYTEGDDPK